MSSPVNTQPAMGAYLKSCAAEHCDVCEAFLDALKNGERECILSSPEGDERPLTDVDLGCIAEALRYPHTIRCLALEENAFGLSGVNLLIKALSDNPNIVRELRLGRNKLQDPSVISIANSLTHALSDVITANSSGGKGRSSGFGLKIIDLSENGVTNVGCGALCHAVSAKTSDVVELSFHNNSLDRDAAPAIVKAITNAPKLKHLHLGYNQLRDTGAIQIARAIPAALQLSTIDLTANKIGRQGGQEIARLLMNSACKLQRINLRSNGFDDDTLKLFSEVIIRNSTLQQLSLGYMDASPDTSALLLNSLLEATRRKTSALLLLDVYGWPMDLVECGPIIEKLMLMGVTMFDDGAEGGGSATSPTVIRAITSDACQPIFHAIDKHNWERQERGMHDIYIGPDDRHSAIAVHGGAANAKPQQQASTAPTEFGHSPLPMRQPAEASSKSTSGNPTATPPTPLESARQRAAQPQQTNKTPSAPHQSSDVCSSPSIAAGRQEASGASASPPSSATVQQRRGPNQPQNTLQNKTAADTTATPAAANSVGVASIRAPARSAMKVSNANVAASAARSAPTSDRQLVVRKDSGDQHAISPIVTEENALRSADLNAHLLLTLSQLQMKMDMQEAFNTQSAKLLEDRVRVLEEQLKARDEREQAYQATIMKMSALVDQIKLQQTRYETAHLAMSNTANKQQQQIEDLHLQIESGAACQCCCDDNQRGSKSHAAGGGVSNVLSAADRNGQAPSSHRREQSPAQQPQQQAYGAISNMASPMTALESKRYFASPKGVSNADAIRTRNQRGGGDDDVAGDAMSNGQSYGDRPDSSRQAGTANNAHQSSHSPVLMNSTADDAASPSAAMRGPARSPHQQPLKKSDVVEVVRGRGENDDADPQPSYSDANGNNAIDSTTTAMNAQRRANSANSTSDPRDYYAPSSLARGATNFFDDASSVADSQRNGGDDNNNDFASPNPNRPANYDRPTTNNNNGAPQIGGPSAGGQGKRANPPADSRARNPSATNGLNSKNKDNDNQGPQARSNIAADTPPFILPTPTTSVGSTAAHTGHQPAYSLMNVKPGHTTPHRGPGTHRPATDFRDPYQDADEYYGNPTGRRRSESPSRLTNEHALAVPTVVTRDEKVDRCYQPNEPSPIHEGSMPSPSLQTSYQPPPHAQHLTSSQPLGRASDLPKRKVPRPTGANEAMVTL